MQHNIDPAFGGVPIDGGQPKTMADRVNAKLGVDPAFGGTSADQQAGKEFSLMETINNIPSSAKKFATDMVQPIVHPIDTGKAVGGVVLGGLDKLARNLVESLPEDIVKSGNKLNNYLVDLGIPLTRLPDNPDDMEFKNEANIDQVGEFIKQRYGSEDAFKSTLMNDPVGVLADAAMVLTAGGSAAARLPGVAGKVGKAVETVGKAAEPINIAKGATKMAASKVISKATPASLYESSAKFSTTLPKAKRTALAETALKHEVLPTPKGVDRLNDIIGDFDTQIDGLIKKSTDAGNRIPSKAVFKHLKEVRRNLGGPKIEASSDLAQVDKVAKSLGDHLKKTGKKSLTPNELQALKQDAYKRINFDAKQLKAGIGKDAARKAIAKGAKEAIESVADVKDLNRELGKLLELKDPIQRSSGRIENRNLIGIGAPLNVVAGSATAGTAGAAGGVLMSILENPKIKARLAIKIKKIQDAGKANLIDNRLVPTLTHFGLLQSGRLSEETKEPDVKFLGYE